MLIQLAGFSNESHIRTLQLAQADFPKLAYRYSE